MTEFDGMPVEPIRAQGGPYTIDPDALGQPFGVPQDVAEQVADDLVAAVDGVGYGADEVVFAGYHAIAGIDDMGPAAMEHSGEAFIDPGTAEPVRGVDEAVFFLGAGSLANTQGQGNSPIHDAGTGLDARIAVYDTEALTGSSELHDPEGVHIAGVDPMRVRRALRLIFHPQYEAGGRGDVREATNPDDLIGADPRMGDLSRSDQGLPADRHYPEGYEEPPAELRKYEEE
jgi:hypothetical protein